MAKKNEHRYKEVPEENSDYIPIRYFKFTYPEQLISFQSHWHEEIELTFVEDGRGVYHIGENSYVIEKGDIVYIKPDTMHSGGMIKGESLKTIVIIFSTHLLIPSNNAATINKYLLPLRTSRAKIPEVLKAEDRGYENFKEIIYSISRAIDFREPAFELKVKSFLLDYIIKLYEHEHVDLERSKPDFYDTNEDTIRTIISYIENNYQNPLSIESLSKLSGFSTCHFMNLFKKYTGNTCKNYINQFRLDTAARELLETKRPIMEIAADCGFNNISFFNRSFKKQFNRTPREYRENPRPSIL